MSRVLPALLIVLSLSWTASAVAQLSIVQSWQYTGGLPGGICYDSDRDHIWVVNHTGNSVQEYTRTGTFVSEFSGALVGLSLPIGMEFDATTGNLWICDGDDPEKVVETTRDGVLVSEFSVDLEMTDAAAIAIATSNDHVYVTDDDVNEVVEWTKAGALVGRWSAAPNGDADAICYLAASNTLLVGDDTQNAPYIYEFALDGTLLNSWDIEALLGIGGTEGFSYDAATGHVFLGDSSVPDTIFEISGFEMATAVEQATWSGVKATFR